MDNGWKAYFSFTRKERTGILMLVLLIGISTALPFLLSKPAVPEKEALDACRAKQAELAQLTDDTLPVHDEPVPKQPVMLFKFDPNTISGAAWKKLGVPGRSIRTIQNYLSKGGRFRKPADLQRIYGFKKEDYTRLAPYIRIPADTMPYNRPVKKYDKPARQFININTADTTAWMALPGIGSKLASRIVHFREKLGGFYTVDQIGETYGLTDSTFQLIKPRLQCAPGAIQKININTADVSTLKQHPYIKWPLANAIVQYRQQHGAFRSVEDLQQIAVVTPEWYHKIAAYLVVEY